MLRLAAAVAFLIGVGLYASFNADGLPGLSTQGLWFLVVAAAVGGCMAMNIGAIVAKAFPTPSSSLGSCCRRCGPRCFTTASST